MRLCEWIRNDFRKVEFYIFKFGKKNTNIDDFLYGVEKFNSKNITFDREGKFFDLVSMPSGRLLIVTNTLTTPTPIHLLYNIKRHHFYQYIPLPPPPPPFPPSPSAASMETTPLHTVNFSTILSESRNIVKANKGHFYVLSLFFLPFSISIVVTPTLHSHLPGNFFTGELFHKSLLSHPIPVVLHLLYILIVYLLIFCGIGTISYSTYNVLIGKPVSYFASLKSLTFSLLPLISTAILAHTIMFLILLTFLLFGGIIVMLGKSLGLTLCCTCTARLFICVEVCVIDIFFFKN